MKKSGAIFSVCAFWMGQSAFACEVCKNNQPGMLKNISHGTGPGGILDYLIIWSAVFFVSVTLFLSIKYLVKPHETSSNHIKNIVVEKS